MFLKILIDSFKKMSIDSFEDFLVDQDRQFQNTQIWGETVSDFFGHIFTPECSFICSSISNTLEKSKNPNSDNLAQYPNFSCMNIMCVIAPFIWILEVETFFSLIWLW